MMEKKILLFVSIFILSLFCVSATLYVADEKVLYASDSNNNFSVLVNSSQNISFICSSQDGSVIYYVTKWNNGVTYNHTVHVSTNYGQNFDSSTPYTYSSTTQSIINFGCSKSGANSWFSTQGGLSSDFFVSGTYGATYVSRTPQNQAQITGNMDYDATILTASTTTLSDSKTFRTYVSTNFGTTWTTTSATGSTFITIPIASCGYGNVAYYVFKDISWNYLYVGNTTTASLKYTFSNTITSMNGVSMYCNATNFWLYGSALYNGSINSTGGVSYITGISPSNVVGAKYNLGNDDLYVLTGKNFSVGKAKNLSTTLTGYTKFSKQFLNILGFDYSTYTNDISASNNTNISTFICINSKQPQQIKADVAHNMALISDSAYEQLLADFLGVGQAYYTYYTPQNMQVGGNGQEYLCTKPYVIGGVVYCDLNDTVTCPNNCLNGACQNTENCTIEYLNGESCNIKGYATCNGNSRVVCDVNSLSGCLGWQTEVPAPANQYCRAGVFVSYNSTDAVNEPTFSLKPAIYSNDTANYVGSITQFVIDLHDVNFLYSSQIYDLIYPTAYNSMKSIYYDTQIPSNALRTYSLNGQVTSYLGYNTGTYTYVNTIYGAYDCNYKSVVKISDMLINSTILTGGVHATTGDYENISTASSIDMSMIPINDAEARLLINPNTNNTIQLIDNSNNVFSTINTQNISGSIYLTIDNVTVGNIPIGDNATEILFSFDKTHHEYSVSLYANRLYYITSVPQVFNNLKTMKLVSGQYRGLLYEDVGKYPSYKLTTTNNYAKIQCTYSDNKCRIVKGFLSILGQGYTNQQIAFTCGSYYNSAPTNSTALTGENLANQGQTVDPNGNPVNVSTGTKAAVGIALLFVVIGICIGVGFMLGMPKIGAVIGVALGAMTLIAMAIPSFPYVGGFIPVWLAVIVIVIAILASVFIVIRPSGNSDGGF